MIRADFLAYAAKCQAKMLIQQGKHELYIDDQRTGDKHFEVAMSGPSEQMMGRALLAQDDYR